MENLASILETLMIVSFGISWPLSIVRSYRSRSTKGKSLMFSCFICFGYICGIISKCLYFRNRAIERKAENGAQG